jgi:c-di-GMP-binding flagellar brake protein YcgR
MDRRKYPRIPYGAWIEDLTREGSIQFYLAKDLSLGGVLLEAATPPEVGHMVHLRLIIENESKVMAVDGQVVRHAATEGGRTSFAVRFMNMDEPRQSFIEEVINECAQAGTPPAAPSPPSDRNADDF